MEEAPEKGKESSHSAHANGMNEMNVYFTYSTQLFHHIHCIQQVLRYVSFKHKQSISTVQAAHIEVPS